MKKNELMICIWYVQQCKREKKQIHYKKINVCQLHKDNNIKMHLTDIEYHTLASDSTGSGQGQVMRCCEHGNEHLASKTSKIF